MKIAVNWLAPLELYDGSGDGLIYSCDLADLPDTPGIYVFARRYGETVSPLYVGKATKSLRQRVKQQLNNVKLMKGIENAKSGARILLPAEVSTLLSQSLTGGVELVERTLIEHYLSQDYELLNIQGTKVTSDEICFSGDRLGRGTVPNHFAVPRR